MSVFTLKAVIDSTEAEAPFEPTPLMAETPLPEPYPVADLGPLAAAAIAVQDITEAPAAIAAQSVLGVAALAAQGLADAPTLVGRAPASLFLLTIAESGERKSTCDGLAMQAVRAFEAEMQDDARRDHARYCNRHALWTAERKLVLGGKKGSSSERAADLDALGPEPEPPLWPTLVPSEPTLEGLTKNMGQLRASLGLFSDEGGQFLGGHSMSAENRLRTASGLSSFWDGSPQTRLRAGDGAGAFRGRRLSAHLMAQPIAARDFLADPVMGGQGLLARFLIAAPPPARGTRLRMADPDPRSLAVLDGFHQTIGAMLRQPLPLRDGSRNELDQPRLTLRADAADLLRTFALATEREQADGCALEPVAAFASKAAEQAARIATVLALFENPGAQTIEPDTMNCAVKLATFYLNEALRVMGHAGASKDMTDADTLRRWLVESWVEPAISVRAVQHRGPYAVRNDADRVRQLLAILEQHDSLVRIEGGAKVDGHRSREAWTIRR